MEAIPTQTIESYKETLEKITSLNPPPEHISAYSLIIEEGTPFKKLFEEGTLDILEEENERYLYQFTKQFLQSSNYERYEISNYAINNKKCNHNIGYWKRENYIGFGLGASSLIQNTRFTNTNNLSLYIEKDYTEIYNIQVLTIEEQMEEFVFLGL